MTIATLGRDRLDGGSDEDADFSAHFQPSRRGDALTWRPVRSPWGERRQRN